MDIYVYYCSLFFHENGLFGNGYVILSHIRMSMYSFIHVVIKVNPCQWKVPLISSRCMSVINNYIHYDVWNEIIYPFPNGMVHQLSERNFTML